MGVQWNGMGGQLKEAVEIWPMEMNFERLLPGIDSVEFSYILLVKLEQSSMVRFLTFS